MAIHCGLRLDVPIASVLSFSGYVVQPELLPTVLHEANKNTQVLAIHGKSDPVVPYDFATERYEAVQELNVPFDLWEDFHMGHFIGDQMMGQMQWWLVKTLNASSDLFMKGTPPLGEEPKSKVSSASD